MSRAYMDALSRRQLRAAARLPAAQAVGGQRCIEKIHAVDPAGQSQRRVQFKIGSHHVRVQI